MKIDWKQFLHQHPIFSTVHDERRIDALLRVSKEHAYVKDRNIVRQSEKGNSLFVIGSGSADALLEVRGEETIPLSAIEKGEVFGEMAFFEQGRRAATVRAKELCTVLEIPGPEIKNLVKDYPDIGFKLLLLMGERLRQTNERILALHLETVDEKLALFNKRLEIDQKVAEAELKAAQAMFDQTKLRADEVIESAERSRDRLNKGASIVGVFVTALVTLLGLFGWKEISKVESSAKDVETYRNQARESAAEIKNKVQESSQALERANQALNGLKQTQVDIYRRRFFDALDRGSASDALQAYRDIQNADRLGSELESLLGYMERVVVAKAQPPSEPEKSNVKNFVSLFQAAVVDAPEPREKLDAFYLLLVYAYLADQEEFQQKEKEYKNLATRQDALAALRDYRRSAPKEERPASEELAKRLRESGKRGEDLREVSRLAFVKVPP